MRSADQQPQPRSSRQAPSLAAELADFGRALRSLFDPYRPERHYMRGRGPKWHAKHDPAPAMVDAAAAPVLVPVRATLSRRRIGAPRA